MKKFIFSLLAIVQLSGATLAQDVDGDVSKIKTKTKTDVTNPSPYRTKFAIDAPAAVVGMGVNALGLYLIQENKHSPSQAELDAIDQDLAVVEQVELARELPLAVGGEDVGPPVLVEVEDLDRALEHEEEVDAPLATLEQERALRHPFLGPVAGQPCRHLLAQAREGLRLTRVWVGRIVIGGGRRLDAEHPQPPCS